MTLTAFPEHYEIKSVEIDHVVVDKWVSEIVIGQTEEEAESNWKKINKQLARERKKTAKYNPEMIEVGIQVYGGWDKDYKSNKNLKISLEKRKLVGLFEEADKRCLRWANRMSRKNQWEKVTEGYKNPKTNKPVQSVSELACVLLSERLSLHVNKNPAVIAEGEMLVAR